MNTEKISWRLITSFTWADFDRGSATWTVSSGGSRQEFLSTLTLAFIAPASCSYEPPSFRARGRVPRVTPGPLLGPRGSPPIHSFSPKTRIPCIIVFQSAVRINLIRKIEFNLKSERLKARGLRQNSRALVVRVAAPFITEPRPLYFPYSKPRRGSMRKIFKLFFVLLFDKINSRLYLTGNLSPPSFSERSSGTGMCKERSKRNYESM